MKIILSPSKTATYQSHPRFNGTELLFPKQTKKLLAVIRKMPQKDLSKALSIQGDLLQQTHKAYQYFYKTDRYPAFVSFTGLVFKQLNMESYSPLQIQYIQEHVRILDALYGVLEPTTLIAPYRLDMKAKLGLNLYQFWDITPYFENEQIINLASTEYSSMISSKMITISFLQHINGTYKNQATYSKMARGQMLDYMITNNVTKIDQIKQFNHGGYQFNEALSNTHTITFTR